MKYFSYILFIVSIGTILVSSCLNSNFSVVDITTEYTFTPNKISTQELIKTPSPLPTQLTVIPTDSSEESEIEFAIIEVINEYFDIHYKALSISPPIDFEKNGFGDLISDLPEAQEFEKLEVAKLIYQSTYWEQVDLRYAVYDHNLSFDLIDIDEDLSSATIRLLDKAKVVRERHYDPSSNDSNKIYREFEFGHIFSLRIENGEWKVVSDRYYDSFWNRYLTHGYTEQEIYDAIILDTRELENK